MPSHAKSLSALLSAGAIPLLSPVSIEGAIHDLLRESLPVWPLVVAAAAFLVISAALSAAEVALFSLGSDQVEALERQHRRAILAAKALLRARDETLITLLLADYVANLALVVCVLIGFSRIAPEQRILWAPLGGVVAAMGIVVFGEFLPRALGRCFNETVVLALARPIVGLTFLLTPFRWLILTISNVFFGRPRELSLEREMGSEEEFKTLLTASDLNGNLVKDERELISGVFGFGSTCVGEIMTPRPRILAFPKETPHDEILCHMRRCKFKRVLVFQGSLDQICGLLNVKEVLLNPETDYHEMVRKPFIVPESKKLMDLLREFRRQHIHLAVVCDEFGRTTGIVTMQDLLEQIVGEMTEEDRRAPEPLRRIGPSTWLVLGRTNLADLREEVGLDLSEDMGRTVSGFIANRLGRIPIVGDSITEGEFVLTVERMAVRRVAILRIERMAKETDNDRAEAHP